MRIAFLGTPDFAVPSLEMLFMEGHDLAVFTQPDRPVGRHGTPVFPPVKQFAVDHGIPVHQFEKIRLPEGVEALKAFAPDLMVTAAFGQLLSQENLDIPKYGCINVHGSLLPEYRGAAPIQWAVIDGKKQTGITTMQTALGMDTGDILLKTVTDIGENETSGELYERLSRIGAETLKETIALLEKGELHPVAQKESEATRCSMLRKENGKISFDRTAQQIHDLVRGVNPWPGAYAMLGDDVLKIWKTRMTGTVSDVAAGTLFGNAKEGLFVMCKDRPLEILELQSPGGKRMSASVYLVGRSLDGRVLS